MVQQLSQLKQYISFRVLKLTPNKQSLDSVTSIFAVLAVLSKANLIFRFRSSSMYAARLVSRPCLTCFHYTESNLRWSVFDRRLKLYFTPSRQSKPIINPTSTQIQTVQVYTRTYNYNSSAHCIEEACLHTWVECRTCCLYCMAFWIRSKCWSLQRTVGWCIYS